PSPERISPQEFDTPAFLGGVGLGYYPASFFGIEAELAASFPSIQDTDDSAVVFNPRAHIVLQIPTRLAPFVLAGGGFHALSSKVLGDDIDTEFHWGAGLKLFMTEHSQLRVEGRQLISDAYNAPGSDNSDLTFHYEVLGSLAFAFGGKPNLDKDKDGILLPDDRCPTIKGTATDGCLDTDKDSFSDRIDKCPSTEGTIDGCPDTDGDDVIDMLDKCPRTAGDMEDGCLNPDPDGDGVLHGADKCPRLYGNVNTFGCPDKDMDKVPDNSDKCPAEPETINGFKDSDGCPDVLPVEIKRFTGSIDGITFSTGRATIRGSSSSSLNAAVGVLREYPELKILIEGHTDSQGNRGANLRLSQERADAVKAYLVGKGIEESRLTALGIGAERPIASNKTRSGRAANRRIEFKVMN
ncbi:MAG: OmpA family protein, partial [Myxococcales bacterium]|nr:OmpA family protein [Myxococcales bacterium]